MRSLEDWVPTDGIDLEPNALEAVTSVSGNLAVLAGPGTGKTELLAQRADFLLRTDICRYPRRILAISFKVDAARNLKERVRRRASPEQAARVDSFTFHAFAKHLIDVFRPVLQGASALDENYAVGDRSAGRRQVAYRDMVPRAIEILQESPVARRAVAQTYSDIFLDEFQDCTASQYELLQAVVAEGKPRLIAVGDAKQSIMQWAGAIDGIFGQYAMEHEVARPLVLYANHRADAALRRFQNAMVRDMEPQAAVSNSSLQGEEGVVALHEYSDELSEAESVADMLAGWAAAKGGQLDAAVLVRNHVSVMTEALQNALMLRGISFRVEDGKDELLESSLGCLVTDFFYVISGGRRPEIYTRLFDAAEAPWMAVGAFEERAARLRQEVERARRRLNMDSEATLDVLARPFLEEVGTPVLSALLSGQEQREPTEIVEEILERLELQRATSESLLSAVNDLVGSNAVRIMTIHKSKGLEFDHVVVLGVEREAFWSKNEWENMTAFFVAASRARHELHLTVTKRRSRPSGVDRWSVHRRPQEMLLRYLSAG